MGKNAGAQQTSTADNAYNQEISDSNQLFQQWMQTYYPQIQQLMPELMSTVQGGNSPLMTAAEAPVKAATSSALNSIQGNAGGTANPAALYEDVALNGQQQAGLAGDQMLSQSLAALQNLFSLGSGGATSGMSGLNAAGSGEANLGEALNQEANAPWQALLGAAGQYAAASAGGASAGRNSNAQGATVAQPTIYNPLASGSAPTTTSFGTTGLGNNNGPISGVGGSGPSYGNAQNPGW